MFAFFRSKQKDDFDLLPEFPVTSSSRKVAVAPTDERNVEARIIITEYKRHAGESVMEGRETTSSRTLNPLLRPTSVPLEFGEGLLELELDETFSARAQELGTVRSASMVKFELLHGSFSGARVLNMTPFRSDGRELPTTIVKYDHASAIVKEAEKTRALGPRWGGAHPKVLDVVLDDRAAGRWGLMQIELCGGGFGVPGLTKAPSVLTVAKTLQRQIAAEEVTPETIQCLNTLGHTLCKWSSPVLSSMDRCEYYKQPWKMMKSIGERVLPKLEEGLRFPRLLAVVPMRSFWDRFLEEDLDFPFQAGMGLSHADFHGGNQLIDSSHKLWLIDYATAVTGGLAVDDLGKLIASTLVMYVECHDEDEAPFQNLCQRVASAPSNGGAFPLSDISQSNRMGAVNKVVQVRA